MLDDLDRALIHALHMDGRAPFSRDRHRPRRLAPDRRPALPPAAHRGVLTGRRSGRTVFLQVRDIASRRITEIIESLLPDLDQDAARTLTTYVAAGAGGHPHGGGRVARLRRRRPLGSGGLTWTPPR